MARIQTNLWEIAYEVTLLLGQLAPRDWVLAGDHFWAANRVPCDDEAIPFFTQGHSSEDENARIFESISDRGADLVSLLPGTPRVTPAVYERCGISLLFRCVVGNVLHPVRINPNWLSWNNGTIGRLAEATYQERLGRRPTHNSQNVLLLHDALIDAGCTDDSIFEHLRQHDHYTAGCWVINQLRDGP